MPHYAYRALAKNGAVIAGRLEAPSKEEAFRRLQLQATLPLALDATAAVARPGSELLSPSRWQRPSGADLVAFFAALDTLLEAKLGVEGALSLAAKETRKRSLRAIIADLHDKVTAGTALSDAMAGHGTVFGPHVVASIEAGEMSGSLPAMIRDLTAALERDLALRQKVSSALIYPAFLVVAALAVMVIIMAALVPAVRPLFEAASLPPPLVLRLLLMAEDATASSSFWVVAGLGLGATVWLARAPRAKPAREAMLLATPLLGSFLRDAELARFAAIAGMLLRGGATLDRTLAAATTTLRLASFRRQAERALAVVVAGSSVFDALAATRLIDGQGLQVLKVAEETGALQQGFTRLARLAEARMERGSERFLKALTPILTLGIGGMIGLIIIAIMDAVLQLNEVAFQ